MGLKDRTIGDRRTSHKIITIIKGSKVASTTKHFEELMIQEVGQSITIIIFITSLGNEVLNRKYQLRYMQKSLQRKRKRSSKKLNRYLWVQGTQRKEQCLAGPVKLRSNVVVMMIC